MKKTHDEIFFVKVGSARPPANPRLGGIVVKEMLKYHIFVLSIIDISMKRVENVIFYTLDRAIKSYRQLAQLRLQRLGITVDQWLVLNMVKQQPGASQQEIADKVFKDTASVTRIVDLLVKKGYLKRGASKTDRRKSELQFTAAGKRLLLSAARVVETYRKDALRRASGAELRRAEQTLLKIISNCSSPA
jgi:MarR family transcriptional regulator, transcriptional regulator for hemolysin